jgi:hypothetical protein
MTLRTAFFGTVAWLPALAVAAPIPVTNASFETPAQTAMGAFENGVPPGWTQIGADTEDVDFGVWWPGFFDLPAGAEDGTQVGVAYADVPIGSDPVGLAQQLPAVLAPNTRYSFEVYVGDPTSYSDPLLAGFPGYRVELRAGGARVIDDDDTAMQEGQLRPVVGTIPVGSTHPGLGQPLEIRLLNRNAAAGAEVDFDAVSVDATPAPIETYAFTVTHDGGTLAGVLVYDRDRSPATQNFDRDAALTITEATGDLAPFAGVGFADGGVNASGGVLNLGFGFGSGDFLLLLFGASLGLDQPLPLASFQSASSSAYVDGVAVVSPGEAGALFTLQAPEASAGAVVALAALAALRRRRG